MRDFLFSSLALTILADVTLAGQNVPGKVDVPLDLVTVSGNVGPAYLANISVGNPPQNVQVQVDTGSSDLWVFGHKNNCNVTMGCVGGSFDPTKSSSYKSDLPGQFEWSYGSGHNGTGDYIRDDVTIGGVTLKNVRLGVTHETHGDSPIYAILGLGMPSNEFLPTQKNDSNASYPNIPTELANQKFISSPTFSLSLSGEHKSCANTLLFGSVDSTKYTGPLKEFPILKNGGTSYSQYYVNLTAVGTSSPNGTVTWPSNSSFGAAAFLDSGSPKAFLPADAAIPIILAAGGEYDRDVEVSVVPCSAKNSTATVDFVIGNGHSGEDVLIKVPMSQLVDPFPGSKPPMVGGEKACSFGVSPGPDGFLVLGDAFLRGAYAEFDLEKKVVKLAQAKVEK